MMSKKIQELKKQFPAEFKRYEDKLLRQNIASVRDGLDILLSIKGVTPDRSGD
jgi:hypothetical protein